MSSFAATLKQEITRLARKEIKANTDSTRRAVAQFRRDIARQLPAGLVQLVMFVQYGGIVEGVAQSLNIAVPRIPVWFWASLAGLTTAVLVSLGYYRLIQGVSIALMAVFTVFTLGFPELACPLRRAGRHRLVRHFCGGHRPVELARQADRSAAVETRGRRRSHLQSLAWRY